MEYSIYINQKAAVNWGLSTSEAILFSFLINGGQQWMKPWPHDVDYKWASNTMLARELPLVCTHKGSARRLMARLEEVGLIERHNLSNKSYFRITEKGYLWKSDTIPKANETVHPEPKGEPNGSPKANQTVCPRANQMVHQSDIQSLSDIQGSEKVGNDLAAVPPTKTRNEPKSNATWNAYSQAYTKRYGAPPKRNQMVNSILCKVVDRLGADESPMVAAYFVTHNNRYYVERRHDIKALASDAEKLHNEWLTGTQTTATQARQVDQKQNNLSVGEKVLAKRKERGLIT